MSDTGQPAGSAADGTSAEGVEPAEPSTGTKRKDPAEYDGSVHPTPAFKRPEQPRDFLRPPLLTVDTSTLEDEIDEPVVPRTPANVRSMKRTELHAAVCAGDVALATRLCADGHAVDPQEEHGFSPLHNAAALEKPTARAALVELLLSHAADACRADNEGYTCLHWAAALGHRDVVPVLLSAGARVAQRSQSGETALHRAARLGRIECVKLLAEAGGSDSLAWSAHAIAPSPAHPPAKATHVRLRCNQQWRTPNLAVPPLPPARRLRTRAPNPRSLAPHLPQACLARRGFARTPLTAHPTDHPRSQARAVSRGRLSPIASQATTRARRLSTSLGRWVCASTGTRACWPAEPCSRHIRARARCSSTILIASSSK